MTEVNGPRPGVRPRVAVGKSGLLDLVLRFDPETGALAVLHNGPENGLLVAAVFGESETRELHALMRSRFGTPATTAAPDPRKGSPEKTRRAKRGTTRVAREPKAAAGETKTAKCETKSAKRETKPVKRKMNVTSDAEVNKALYMQTLEAVNTLGISASALNYYYYTRKRLRGAKIDGRLSFLREDVARLRAELKGRAV